MPAAVDDNVPPEAAGRGGKGDESVGVTDEFLVARLKSGDAVAGGVLVERYAEPLMRYLRRSTGSDAAAEDAHQATWLSVLEHLDRFDDASTSGGFKAWLYRIATNKAHDGHRKFKRDMKLREQLSTGAAADRPPGGQTSRGRSLTAGPADEPLYRAERASALREAIDALPEPQRQVVLLRYDVGLKFNEIADLLGCPLNTALGRMHKAAAKLRKALAGYQPDDEA